MIQRAWLKPLRNAGILAGGKLVHGVLSFIALALAARTLGIDEFGLLALLHGLVMTLAQLANFNSWQTVVRYGADALERLDRAGLRRILMFAFGLDLLAAALAAVLILLFAVPVARLLGVPEELLPVARIYAFTALLLIGGNTGFGILRLLDRFDRLAIQNTSISLVRALGSLALFLTGGDLVGFLVVWAGAIALSRLLLYVFSAREIARRALGAPWQGDWRVRLAPVAGIWRFAIGTHLIGTLRLTEARLGLLLVGALLGPAAAGLYRIAQQFADVVAQPIDKLLVPALLPELTRSAARGDTAGRRDLVLRPALASGAFALFVLVVLGLFGRSLIALSVGPEFTDAWPVMMLLILAALPIAATFSLEPLLISLGRLRATILARIAASTLYIVLLVVLTNSLGLIGAGLAALAYGILIATALVPIAARAVRG
ncbi:MAG: oligosaccharide flippase family protein [Wenzhouxiangellaceae bacterium]|nr:oligosaccharide flippase family protein [Wenzhouxiangellaceae bacterium]